MRDIMSNSKGTYIPSLYYLSYFSPKIMIHRLALLHIYFHISLSGLYIRLPYFNLMVILKEKILCVFLVFGRYYFIKQKRREDCEYQEST
jgi:hypothetical protein